MNTKPAICLICGLSAPLLAAPDPLAHLSDKFAPELTDSKLDNLRGRYVSTQGISYFGIEFISTLANAQAQQQTAAMSLLLSVQQNKPTLDIRAYDNGNSTNEQTQGRNIQGSGLVQVMQLQGNGNNSINQMGITLTAPSLNGNRVPLGNYQGSLGTSSYSVSGNYIGLQLHSFDGRVQLEQSLRGNDLSRGLLQLNQVNGDGFTTINQTRIWFSP